MKYRIVLIKGCFSVDVNNNDKGGGYYYYLFSRSRAQPLAFK